jgi:hypothetical protein
VNTLGTQFFDGNLSKFYIFDLKNFYNWTWIAVTSSLCTHSPDHTIQPRLTHSSRQHTFSQRLSSPRQSTLRKRDNTFEELERVRKRHRTSKTVPSAPATSLEHTHPMPTSSRSSPYSHATRYRMHTSSGFFSQPKRPSGSFTQVHGFFSQPKRSSRSFSEPYDL